LRVSKGSGELQRIILDVMATQSVGHLGIPLSVIRACVPDASDRLIDRAVDSLTRWDLIETGPVPGMRRLVDRDARSAARQNQEACRSATQACVERPERDLVAELIAKARTRGRDTDDGRTVERDHAWDAFEIFDRPYRDDVPIEIQALTEVKGWPRRLARLLRHLGSTVVRGIGDVRRELAGSDDDQLRTAARRAADQRRWFAYVTEVRAFTGEVPASKRESDVWVRVPTKLRSGTLRIGVSWRR
jgi:hypothetical protein